MRLEASVAKQSLQLGALEPRLGALETQQATRSGELTQLTSAIESWGNKFCAGVDGLGDRMKVLECVGNGVNDFEERLNTFK